MVVGLVGRLAFGLGYWVDKPLTHDEHEYLALARSLSNHDGFRYPDPAPPELGRERFSRAPLYPFFVSVTGGEAVSRTQPRSSPRSIKVAQAMVGTLGVLLVALVAWRVAGRTAGAVGAILASVYPPLTWITAYVLSETLYSVLALLTILLLSLALDSSHNDRRTPTMWMVLGGGTAGLATLTRPDMLVFVGLLGGWLLWRRSWRLALALSLGAVVVVAPWTIRNAREHGQFVLVSAAGGVNFWTGNHPLARGEGDMSVNPDLARANDQLREAHPGLSAEELEPIYYRETFAHIRREPVVWLGLLARKFFYLWVPVGPSYTARSARYYWTSVLSYALVLPVALAGARTLWRSGRPPIVLYLLALSVVVGSVAFFPQERFRIPVLDPTMIILSSAWFASRTEGHVG